MRRSILGRKVLFCGQPDLGPTLIHSHPGHCTLVVQILLHVHVRHACGNLMVQNILHNFSTQHSVC